MNKSEITYVTISVSSWRKEKQVDVHTSRTVTMKDGEVWSATKANNFATLKEALEWLLEQERCDE